MTAQPKYEVYTICGVTHTTKDSIEADFLAELAQIQAESIGWIPLDEGVYLHVSDENATEVLVVGVPQAGAAVLLVGCGL
jgi:hypothetical protein